ncbi:MAG: hypothetical protein K0S55_2218, partial [Clostridia bacterium]|nr:hypothetical protein [Clostridia bacterium]
KDSSLILGIDQGGTKTEAVISTVSGDIMGYGKAGGACYFYDGIDTAMEKIKDSVAKACKNSSITIDNISFAYAGISGINWDDEQVLITDTLSACLKIKNTTAVNDCVIALRSGSGNPYRIVLCAGTEFNAAVKIPNKAEFLYNNYVSSHDMGGVGIGKRALEAVFNADIGLGEKTALTEYLLQLFNEKNLNKLLFKYKRNNLSGSLKDVAFPLFKAAKEGDSVSLKIIKDFAVSISRYAVAGINKYNLFDKEIDVVLAGGIFKESFKLLEETISSEIHSVCPKANIFKAKHKPVIGALLSTLDVIYNYNIPLHILNNIENSINEFIS